jgi:hypothetical protein
MDPWTGPLAILLVISYAVAHVRSVLWIADDAEVRKTDFGGLPAGCLFLPLANLCFPLNLALWLGVRGHFPRHAEPGWRNRRLGRDRRD